MKTLVADFLNVEGNRCAFLLDDNDLTTGVIIQSKMQAEVFEQWPEFLVVDFTYNTINLGYKMGT